MIIVVVYIALLFAISFYVKSRADKGSAEYLFAGRKLGPVLIAVNITGLAVGAASTVGVAENAYKVGMAAGWYNAAWSAGAIIMGLVAAGKLRAMKVSTIPEFFEKYYDTKGRVISAVGLVIIMSVITALQYLAGGAILASLLPEYFSFRGGMIVSAVVFIGITLIGGLWSSGLSNIVSVVLIYAGILYSCVAAVDHSGGLDAIAAQLPAGLDWFDPFAGIPLAVIIGWFIVMITQAITAQGPVQIACGARDAKTARNGFILGGLLIFPVGFLCALLGIIGKVQFPEISATLALPKVLGAGTLFSQDIYKRFINPSVTDDHFVKINRLTILAVGIITLWFAFNAAGILKTMVAGLSMTTALTCVFLFTVFAPGLCRRSSAFWTTLAGLLGLVVWEFVPALHVLQHVIYFEWLLCIIVFLIVAVFDKTPIKKPEMVEED